jgi:predicted RNA-binding protein YlxR (DUF448 family)
MLALEADTGPETGPTTESDAPRGRRDDPLRRCIVSGAIQAKDGMIRFVIGPDGTPVPDLEGRLPGRGLWVGAERRLLERAVAKNLFAKAARRAVRVDAGLPDQVARLVERRCLALIGLARRAGQVLAGYDKVHEALAAGRVGRSGPPGLLLAASDGADDGRGKMRAIARGLPMVETFDAATLGAALGRERVVHALLARGSLADRLRAEAGRLPLLRTSSGPAPAGRSTGSTTDQSDTND